MKMKALPRERLDAKTGTLTLQGTRLPCDKRMAYAAVGGGLDTEHEIRLPSRKGQPTKTDTPTSQDARLSCDKRMVYTAVRRELNTESVIRLLGRKGSEYKIGYPDFAECPIAMRQAHGLCYGLRGSER